MTRQNCFIPKRIAIPAFDLNLRRWVEWLGYFPESMSPQSCVMRLDVPNGFREVYSKPPIDVASIKLIRALPA